MLEWVPLPAAPACPVPGRFGGRQCPGSPGLQSRERGPSSASSAVWSWGLPWPPLSCLLDGQGVLCLMKELCKLSSPQEHGAPITREQNTLHLSPRVLGTFKSVPWHGGKISHRLPGLGPALLMVQPGLQAWGLAWLLQAMDWSSGPNSRPANHLGSLASVHSFLLWLPVSVSSTWEFYLFIFLL